MVQLTTKSAGDGQCILQVGARANTDGWNINVTTASAKNIFDYRPKSNVNTSAGCGFKIFTKDTTIGRFRDSTYTKICNIK